MLFAICAWAGLEPPSVFGPSWIFVLRSDHIWSLDLFFDKISLWPVGLN
jgi:hypothetical protein